MSFAVSSAETLTAEAEPPSSPKIAGPDIAAPDTESKPEPPRESSRLLYQQATSITLDGPTIAALAVGLVSLIHFGRPYVAEAFVCAAAVSLFVCNDYSNFLRLGPGGTPATVQGYIRISWLRLWQLRDPRKAPPPEPLHQARQGILDRNPLPYRAGPLPLVTGIAPQRQLDQHGSRYCYQALRRTMEKLGLKSPAKFGTERSCVEKHGLALFARHPLVTTCQGEICHVHDTDHSMHMCLRRDDIKEVLDKGWGQRHPLAWTSRFFSMPVSPSFVMVYAPRNEQELQTVCRIIEAAIWYTVEEDIKLDVWLGSP